MIIKDFLPPNLTLDKIQLQLLDKLEVISNELLKKKSNQTWLVFWKPRHINKSGVYLYGGVGRGKSMLMRGFFNKLINIATMIHYQDFMGDIHKNLHNLQGKKTSEIVATLAKNYAKKWRVICLDELEIKDITDAMIISNLFMELSKNNVFIFVTSNIKPEELYKDGLQRESFLPFIAYVKQNFEVLILDNDHDYRLDNIPSNRIFYPLNLQTTNYINVIIFELTDNNSFTNSDIEVFGRKISFKRTYKNILITDFQELCFQDFGYVDYVNICQKFKIIVLQNVSYIADSNNDLITRFINFIDNAYFYKVLLFISLEDEPAKIYQKGRLINDFKRTISRLYEMNSHSYANSTSVQKIGSELENL